MKYFVILCGLFFLAGLAGNSFAQYIGNNDNPEVLNERIGVGLTRDITWPPPIKQIKQFEFEPENVRCNSGFELVFKISGTPACVKPGTKEKLVERGWAGEILVTKETLIENYSILPEVMVFYEIYEDVQVSLGEDHVSYFAGSDDGYFVRMNLFYDENYAIKDMDFHCYFQRTHQYELPSEDIALKIKKYDCREYGDAIEPEHEDRFAGTVKVEGEMAGRICEIVGQDCLPYYIGNPQPDGSLMVGITISDTMTEKQFVFLIRNETLSYNVTLKED